MFLCSPTEVILDYDITNMKREELKALHELKSNKDIIIKQADKGNAVVVMDKQLYSKKILEILQNDENYIQLQTHSDKKVMERIKELKAKHSTVLTK